ncbi:MAG: PAS domain S-box protein, partial [Spirochaetota bacterium]|nr:PAS domain S-box protein [Spirochaetota bacterium]
TNEELTTVNDELSTKTIQLTEALDDMEIIQNSTDRAIIVVDKELSIRRYNKKSLAFFKIDTAINMQNLASVPVFFEMENLVDKVRQVNWEGKRFMVEFTMDSRQFELDIFPYKTETIHINGGAIINISDITERSDAIRIIRENEIRFRSMIENAGDAIYIHDHLGNIYEVNQVACQQTAYSHRELLAQNVKQLDVGVDFKALKKMWSEGLSDPKKYPLTLETAHRRKDGSVFPIEVRISLMPYQGENRFLAMVRDISERKEAEALLAEKIRELDFQKSALDEHSIVYTINHDGIISYVNEKLCQISGYSRKELVKQHHSMLYDESYDDKMLAKVCQFISKGKVWKGELKSLKKNGHSFWIASTFVPFLNERNMPFQYIAIHTDITDRVIAQSEAEKANKAKSEFLSSMSHELRTPLNSILGLSDLLMTDEDRPLHEDQLNDISLIKMSGSHLLNLIDEILDLARIETRQMTISSQGIKPWDTIKTTFGMLEDMAKKHEVHLNTSESINCVSCPMPCSIFVDSNRFRQILLNLLSNAVKYNKPGGEVKLICRRQDEGFMRFEVIDSGKGIPEDRYDEIFQPFNRLGAEEKGIDGTGIGLTITKELVELLGGTIGFKSQMDKGSVFWIHLPLENGQNEKTIQSSPENVSSKKTGHSGQFSDNKVLYIEDNVFNTELMYKIFSRLDGISLETATNAEQGIELAKKNLPELILMDINL